MTGVPVFFARSTGQQRYDNQGFLAGLSQRECMQIEGAESIDTNLETELLIQDQAVPLPGLETWNTRTFCGTTYGVGKDNPVNPYSLTDQQKARSIMVEIVNKSSFQVRYSIDS